MNLQLLVPINTELTEEETNMVASFMHGCDPLCVTTEGDFVYFFTPNQEEDDQEPVAEDKNDNG